MNTLSEMTVQQFNAIITKTIVISGIGGFMVGWALGLVVGERYMGRFRRWMVRRLEKADRLAERSKRRE